MQLESVIVSDPEILGSTPYFPGTRVPVDTLIDENLPRKFQRIARVMSAAPLLSAVQKR